MITSLVLCNCDYCKTEFYKSVGHYNRAKKINAPLYCNKTCAGLGRRKNRPVEEKKRLKSEYDKQYRLANLERLRREKKEHYEKNKPAILEQMKVYRKKRMPKHVEYCRQPKYREYKKEYDKRYRAKKDFGDFAEAAIILNDIETIIDSREAFRIKGKFNYNTQKRKRTWKSSQPKI